MPRVSAAELAAIEAEYPDDEPTYATGGLIEPGAAVLPSEVEGCTLRTSPRAPGDLERNEFEVRLHDKHDPVIGAPPIPVTYPFLKGDV